MSKVWHVQETAYVSYDCFSEAVVVAPTASEAIDTVRAEYSSYLTSRSKLMAVEVTVDGTKVIVADINWG